MFSQPMSVCVENCDHMSQLESEEVNRHVLIGSDYYWELTNEEIIRGTTGPVAVNTQLGGTRPNTPYRDREPSPESYFYTYTDN